jgi:hypothetical protein
MNLIRKEIHMSHNSSRVPLLRRLWKPTAVTGAGGTAVVIWFEELLLLSQELLALIFLPIIAGVIYLLDNLIFRSRMPCREDLNNINDKGVNK